MKDTPTLTYDPDVKALYIQLTDSDVLETVELAKGVYLDLDADGQAVGFEILDADETLLSSIPALPATASLRDLLSSHSV
ncbi:MAG TPA: DUF2283 domain-containing protein [Thermomicrobiales bacterium]|nr:DUF2283 domain-containing protein [Thermomicrobiales bacterium]